MNNKLEYISWVKYNDQGLQIGENQAHWANWETGRTLCGLDLRPASGMRAGWDRHNYDGGSDVATCCKRCGVAKGKINDKEFAEEVEYEKIVEQKKAELESKVCGRWLSASTHKGEEGKFYEELIEGENFFRIYYEGDKDWTEVDQETYEFFREQVEVISL